MLAINEADLKAIAPYDDQDISAAMQRVVAHSVFAKIAAEFFPGVPRISLEEKARGLKSIEDFQRVFIDTLLRLLEKRTSSGICLAGTEAHSKTGRFLYLSNHRDILLDPALFTDMLFRNGYRTPQICLGDNLLLNPLALDLVKMNKGITVKRDLSTRELLRWSTALSYWIRSTITSGKDSVWIAQQEGRAKDGNDETQPGVIKMLALSGDGVFVERLRGLHIVPVTVSYEYDPNDVHKALELHRKSVEGRYEKEKDEDVVAVVRGIRDFKGGIHIQVGAEIVDLLDEAELQSSRVEQVRHITQGLSTRIRKQYKNWPSNYIACDLLGETTTFSSCYSLQKKEEFVERLNKRLQKLELTPSDEMSVRRRVLGIYAASVKEGTSYGNFLWGNGGAG